MVTIPGKSGKKYEFECYYSSTLSIADRSGVYVVLDKRPDGLFILDVGESSTPQYRLQNHDRKNCWERSREGIIVYGIYYTPNQQQQGRMDIEQDIRNFYGNNNLCGDR